MSTTPSLTILPKEQKFNGDNLLQWTTNMTQLLGSKRLLGYIEGKIVKPSQPAPGSTAPDSTPIYSTSPNFDKLTFRDQLTQGHITLNCTDVASLGSNPSSLYCTFFDRPHKLSIGHDFS